jgi:glycosyltransferase 2 family protein
MQDGHKIGKGLWYTLLFSIISLYFIFQVVVKISLRHIFSGVNWAYIGLGFISLFFMWLAKTFRMYAIGQGMGIKIRLDFYLQLYLATCFISHVTPFNSGGTPLQVYILHKTGVPLGQATALTVVDLGLNTLMFFILIPVALFTSIHLHGNGNLLQFNPFFNSLIVLACIIIIGLMFSYWKVWPKLSQWIWIIKIKTYIGRKGWRQHFQGEWERFKEGCLMLIHQHPVSIFWAIIATIMYWFFYLLLAPIIFWAMGQSISFFQLIGWQLIFNFAQTFIPTPGGSGGSELVLVYLFRNLIGATRVGTFVLLWKIYTFFSTLIIGSFFFWKLTKKS